jgi:2-dehydropantoate 2-reductase
MTDFNVLLIGDGRLAHHLKHYLTHKHMNWVQWRRADGPSQLRALSEKAQLSLLAVSDSAIEDLAHQLSDKTFKIHFSGSHLSDLALGIHPLMTFSELLYAPEFYDQIPLIIDKPVEEMGWLKKLPNPQHVITKDRKSLYHGICHLSGNLPKFLWTECFEVLEEKLGVPKEFFGPYLKASLDQVLVQKTDLRSGPFGRKDQVTIENHLNALNSHSNLLRFYECFQRSFNEREKLHEPS